MLTPDQEQRAEDLFNLVADLPSAERAPFLKGQCGADKVLLERVTVLLAEMPDDDQRLHASARGIPQRVGPYRVLEQIGEGGMGAVYLAQEEQPQHRKVALKILRMGMASENLVARFESERRALAVMDHPNVARWLDSGATETGRPFFVMEYVPGAPISTYCDERRLRIEGRLEIFLDVCAALQHAHEHGIVHRDIKPSNVLVMEQDGRAVPKVIDFGIASVSEEESVAKTALTSTGQVVGTLEYMSPEQADPSERHIDGRSDVYSLGCLLYELLTGSLPFDWEALRREPFWEWHRTLADDHPPSPSTRLASDGAGLVESARKRRTDADTLVRHVRGDLDWIVLKALEAEPVRRYTSASDLGLDIRRFLAHERVLARRPSRVYHLRKLVRRHRAIVATLCLALLVLIGGLTTGLLRERSARAKLESQTYLAHIAAARAALEVHDVAEARLHMERIEPAYRSNWEWRYLGGELDHSQQTMRGHRGPSVVAWHTDEDQDLIASGSRTIRIWDPDSGELLHSLDSLLATGENRYGHRRFLTSLQFSSDGTRLASVRTDARWKKGRQAWVEVWDVAQGERIDVALELDVHEDCRVDPDLTRAAYQDRDLNLIVQEFGSSEPTVVFEGHGGGATAEKSVARLAWSPDGKRIASVLNFTLRIWDADTGVETLDHPIEFPWHGTSSVAFSPGGDVVAAAVGADFDVQLWDAVTGEPLCTLVGHENWVSCIDFSPVDSEGEPRIVTTSYDRTIRVWDGENLRAGGGRGPLATLHGHESGVTCVDFSADGTRIVSAARHSGSALKIWGVERTSRRIGEGHMVETNIGPHGKIFVGCGKVFIGTDSNPANEDESHPKRNPHLDVLRPEPEEPVSLFLATGLKLGRRSQRVALSPDGAQGVLIATVANDGRIGLWDAWSGELLEFIERAGCREMVAFDASGDRFATSMTKNSDPVLPQNHGRVELWSTTKRKLIRDFGQVGEGFVAALAFSHDGALLAAGDVHGQLAIWSIDELGSPARLFIEDGNILGLAFRPGGRVLAALSQRMLEAGAGHIEDEALELLLIDVKTMRVTARTRLGDTNRDDDNLPRLSVSSDGSRILCVGTIDALIHVIDADTGDKVLSLDGPTYAVRGARFLQDHDDRVVSADILGNVGTYDPGRGDRFARHLEVAELASALVDDLIEELEDLELVVRALRDHPDCKDLVFLDSALRHAYAPPSPMAR